MPLLPRSRWRLLPIASTLLASSAWGCASAPGRAVAPDLAATMMRAVHDSIVRVLDRAIADSAFPGAISVIGTRDGRLTSYAAGRIDWPANAPPPDERTLWDLASLTKVVGMTTAMMQLVEQGRVDLDTPVARYLPEFTGEGKERVTVRHLLTHSSGLPAWRPLYKEATTADTALAIVLTTPLDTVPGARMVYSDLGAILLGKIVECVSGEPLDAYVARHLTGPLGMTSTIYRPDASQRARVAPTEFDPWRQRHLRGEVHDENAFRLEGVSGHAGLFATAADLTRFARMLLAGGTLDGAQILRPVTIAQFTAVQNPRLSHRALGWETPNGQNSAGHRMSARAFGHTGFTGTSLWIDPERGVFVLLLSNRVNPSRQNTRIGLVRVALADAAMAAFDGATVPLTPRLP